MPLVSIIIPTHNRAHYAVETVRSLLSLQGDLEIVVCDTSAQDDISPAFSLALDSGRLRLVRPSKPIMSVVDNFNEALLAATGDYLVFIGDDDFVSHRILDVALWSKENSIESIKFTFPILYFWNDFGNSEKWGASGSTLQIGKFNGTVSRNDPIGALHAAITDLGGGVLNMPRAYAGMISSSLVKRIIDKYDMLFGGVSPDIYSAALISLESKNNIKIDYPIIIPGASGASTSGQSANGQHHGGLRDNAHIAPFIDLIWDPRIPEFYSVPTVWSFSLVKAAERAGIKISLISFCRLYLKCFLFHKNYNQYTLRSLKTLGKNSGVLRVFCSLFLAFAFESFSMIQKIAGRVSKKINNSNVIIIENVDSIVCATDIIEKQLAKSCALNLPEKK